MKRSVLIISELFYPSSRIGAVRPTKLAKYLHRKGYDVTVFTSAACLGGTAAPAPAYRVLYAGAQAPAAARPAEARRAGAAPAAARRPRLTDALLQELRMTKRQYLAYAQGRAFRRLFCEALENGSLCLDDFDCVFSSFGPVGSLLAGMEAKKRRPAILWINDFRDPMVSQITPKTFAPFYTYLQRKSIRMADCTVTVSDGYRKRMRFRRMKRPLTVIPNGFDREDRGGLDVTAPADKLSFAYVGALYEGKRDLSVLFRCLRRLVDEGVLSAERLSFDYAGGEGGVLYAQAERYGLGQIVDDHGWVSREESLRIQSRARCLVLATWNDRGEEGVFPGKLLEYMLLNKPVVSVVGGSLGGSEVTQVIERYRLGVSCENADPDAEQTLYAWLKGQALGLVQEEPVCFSPDQEAIIRAYDWDNLAERFCELIDG